MTRLSRRKTVVERQIFEDVGEEVHRQRADGRALGIVLACVRLYDRIDNTEYSLPGI